MRIRFFVLSMLLFSVILAAGVAMAKKPGGGGGKPGGGGNAAPPHQLTLLGTLGGELSVGEGLNNRGDVVGYAETDIPWAFVDPETDQLVQGSWRHGFIVAPLDTDNDGSGDVWYADVDLDGKNDLMIDLQDLWESEGLIAPAFDYLTINGWYVQQAYDVNDQGQIIAKLAHIEHVAVPGGTKPRSTETEYVRYTPAVTDANGTVIVPAKLDDLGGFRPTAINNRGDVVGYGGGAAGNGDHPFVWSDGPNIWTNATSFPAELPQFADRSTLAFDINDNGQIAGLNNWSYRAWRFTPGVGYENLGSGYKGKYNNSSGHAINNNGDVACESSGGSSVSACRYTDADGFDKLGTLGGNSSYCNGGGINSAGDMVGYSETSDGGMHVFLETADLGMVDLETAITNLPADLGNKIRSSGMDINDTGVVLGRAGDGSGLQPSLLGHTYEAYVLKRLPTP